MDELLKLKDKQIEALQKELQKHKDFILQLQKDFEQFREEIINNIEVNE